MLKRLSGVSMLCLLVGASACAPMRPAATSPQNPGEASFPGKDGVNRRGEQLLNHDSSDGKTVAMVGAERVQVPADMSDVKPPGEAVVHMRWKDPEATVQSVLALSSLPPASLKGLNGGMLTKKMMQVALKEGLDGMVDLAAFVSAVDLNAPVELVVVIDTSDPDAPAEPIAAWSIGLTSIDLALAATKSAPQRYAPGVWGLGSDPDNTGPCAVVAAAGTSPGKVVCSDNHDDLLTMANYMARNIARVQSGKADLSVKMMARGMLDKYGPKLLSEVRQLPVLADARRIGKPAFDTALVATADALAIEAAALVQDLDALSLNIGFLPAGGIDLSGQVTFAGHKSFIVDSMFQGAQLRGPAPAIFWHAPKAATMVSWARGGDPARSQPILRTLRTLLEGVLAEVKVGNAADRRAITKLLRTVGTNKNAPVVTAQGYGRSPGASGTAASMVTSTQLQMMLSGLSWTLFGMQEPFAQNAAYVREIVKVFNRPNLQQLARKQLGAHAKFMPTLTVVPAPRGLKGALALQLVIPHVEELMDEATLGGKTDLTLYLLLAPDGKRSWGAMGAELPQLGKLVKDALGAQPGPNSIATMPGLDRLRSESHNGASVTTLMGLVDWMEPLIGGAAAKGVVPAGVDAVAHFRAALAGMPNAGTTPIITTADLHLGTKPRYDAHMVIKRETLADLASLITYVATNF